jgi:hypothetical protein
MPSWVLITAVKSSFVRLRINLCGPAPGDRHSVDRSWIALVIRETVKMAKVTVGVEVIPDPLLQLLHVRKGPIGFPVPDDLAIVGDHKDTTGSGLK